MVERRCPDCGVGMESVGFEMYDANKPRIVTQEQSDGLLGHLGRKERVPVDTVASPECGLVRHYADLDR